MPLCCMLWRNPVPSSNLPMKFHLFSFFGQIINSNDQIIQCLEKRDNTMKNKVKEITKIY